MNIGVPEKSPMDVVGVEEDEVDVGDIEELYLFEVTIHIDMAMKW